MVCLGPSKACRRCKVHKVKCDGLKPRCRLCIKAGSACSGIEAFRDQTEMIKKKIDARERAHRDTQFSHAGKAKYSWKSECRKEEGRYPVFAQPFQASLSQCPEQQSLCFYLTHLLPLLPGYYTDEIPNILVNDSHSSVLSTITQATALNFMSLLPQYAHYRVLAVSKYAEALRYVRQGISDPVLGQSDALLLAILMLGTWEHSHSLHSESSKMSSHMIGAMAMIQNRIVQQSKPSSLFLRLFRFVRAGLIYHCIEFGDNQPLESFCTDVLKSDLSYMNAAVEDTADNGFCGLAELACNIPRLLHRTRVFLEHADRQVKSYTSKAADILGDLKLEEKGLASWLDISARPDPSINHSISKRQTESSREELSLGPCRAKIYVDAPYAASCNSWRLCRILVLDKIAEIAQILASVDTAAIQSWSECASQARSKIQELVDDIRASAQFYLGEIKEDDHRRKREDQSQRKLKGEELIANWSQMKSVLSKGSQLDCLSAGQREWMSQYVSLLSGEMSRSARIC